MRMRQRWMCRSGSLRLVIATDSSRDTWIDKSSLASGTQINFQTLFAATRNGDAVASAVQQHCLNIWAVNAVALIHAYDPEVVVFGGGVMQSADVILSFVEEHVRKHA